jgi:tRNA (mo5U34)-methyltransferase
MFATDITEASARELVASMRGCLQAFEVFPGVRLPGAYDPGGIWSKLRLAGECAGKRVLEIGPAEGYFTKQLASSGADVTALDYRSKAGTGFWVMERLSGRSFSYVQGNILDPEIIDILGTFDIVLFLGVIYHLPDLIRGLDNCRTLCRGTLFLESLCDTELPAAIPAARYLPANSRGGDWTNFWAPNRTCLEAMLRDCGFDPVRCEPWGDRVLFEASTIQRPGSRLKTDMAYSRVTGSSRAV